jgi:uncharacterized metal-binding protein
VPGWSKILGPFTIETRPFSAFGAPRNQRRRCPRLELLASCRDGCTEALMLAHGLSIDMMLELNQLGTRDSADRTPRQP